MLKILGATATDYLNFLLTPLMSGTGPDEFVQLVLYKGTRPANITDPVLETDVVVRYNLNRGVGAYTISSTSTTVYADLAPPNPKLAENTGEVTFFRIISWDNDETMFEGDVTDRSGSGELKLSTTNILLGIYVRVLSARITIPLET